MTGLAANAAVTFTATNGFGDGAARVGQFGYLWDQSSGSPSSWSGEQYWTSGTLVTQVGASGDWYLHLRSYNNDSPKAANTTTYNFGPYTVGGSGGATCLQNAGFESGFASGVGNNWSKFAYLGSVTCSDSTSSPHGGSHCQQVVVASSSNQGGVYQQFQTTPNTTYTVKVWIKVASSTNTTGYLGVDPYGGTDSTSGNVWWGGKNSTTWSQKTWTGTALASKLTVYLDAESNNSSSATVWFDDAEPVCSNVPSAPVDGTPVALSTTSIRWMWTDVANETGYRAKNTGGTAVSGDLAANTTQWDETTGITANTQYTRRIYAFNADGESSPSTGQTRYSLIETPTGITFGAVTATSIVATASGTISNPAAGSSGVRISNTTSSDNSGWLTSAGPWTSSGLVANTQCSFPGPGAERRCGGDGGQCGGHEMDAVKSAGGRQRDRQPDVLVRRHGHRVDGGGRVWLRQDSVLSNRLGPEPDARMDGRGADLVERDDHDRAHSGRHVVPACQGVQRRRRRERDL